MNILDNPQVAAALQKAKEREAVEAAELKGRIDAAAAKLAAARQEREAAIAAQQAANHAEHQERARAEREERLFRQWLASGGRAEEWPSVRERVIVAATVAPTTPAVKPFTL